MPTALTKAAEEALALFRHHDALAIANRGKANRALERFLDIISYGTDSTALLGSVPQCVKVWTRWLSENGPDTRRNITEATGRKFTERGTPHTLRWEDIEDRDTASIPENTIIRFASHGLTQGRGAQPVIYALWSQRYDVLPKFGVGPERPVVDTTGTSADLNGTAAPQPEPMLGVIQPPTWDDLVNGAKPWPEQSFDFAVDVGEPLFRQEIQSNESEDGMVPTVTPDEWRADNGYPLQSNENRESTDG